MNSLRMSDIISKTAVPGSGTDVDSLPADSLNQISGAEPSLLDASSGAGSVSENVAMHSCTFEGPSVSGLFLLLQAERARAEAEKTRADDEKARAEAEKTRADAATKRAGGYFWLHMSSLICSPQSQESGDAYEDFVATGASDSVFVKFLPRLDWLKSFGGAPGQNISEQKRS